MASATTAATTPTLNEGQAKSLGRAAQLAAAVLLLLALATLATSVVMFLSTTLLSLLGLVEGALIGLLALILIKIATDLRYAREVPSLNNVHLLNAIDSWQDFCKTLIGLAVVALDRKSTRLNSSH